MSRETHQLYFRTIKISISISILLASYAAQAKSMDYGTLEKLFNEPVTTSVTGSPQRSSEVPDTMEIITADDIRRSGAKDIPGVLRHVVGVDVLQFTNNQADVSIRGYNQTYNPRLLVLIDGRQVYTDFYGFTPWDALPIELNEIRQIEVIKGPNSAIFGFNAAGGVINIITYNPLYDNVNNINLTGGTQTEKDASVFLMRKIKNVAIKIAAGAHYNNDFSTPQLPEDVGTRRDGYLKEVNMDVRTLLTDYLELDIEGTFSQAGMSDELPTYNMGYSMYNTKSLKAALLADTRYGDIKATIYKNEITDNIYIESIQTPYLRFENNVTVGQLEDVFKIGANHIFRVAAESRYNTMPTVLFNSNVYYHLDALSGMWSWKIKPNVTLTNALRVDYLSLARDGFQPFLLSNAYWNRTHTEPSFNTGLVWQPDDVDTLRFIISRGVQLPNLAQLGGLIFPIPPFGYYGGIPTLNPTTVMNYEIGWDRLISVINSQTRVTAFHEITRDITAFDGGSMPSAGLVSTPANIGHSEATGLELGIKGTFLKAGRWGASYTPEVIRDYFSPSFIVTGQDFKDTTPVNVLNGNLGWTHNQWEFDSFARYESSFYGLQGNRSTGLYTLIPIHDYLSIDGRVAYKLTKDLTLALSGQNIMQLSQRQTSAPKVERRILLSLSANV